MPSNSDPASSNDDFRKVEAKLGSIQAIARKISETPKSWAKRILFPAAFVSRQGDFNIAVVDALKEAVTALREASTSQDIRLEQLERDLTELRSLSTEVRELRERSTTAETQLARMQQEQAELRERSAAAETQMMQLVEKIGQLSAGQGDLGSELRERIQHLLDEQRVCHRQLSLKTSEEAVLAERARRATELRLEELARRLPERPA
jgi:predicted  nucleic acid-binding Zn-ribbon protein